MNGAEYYALLQYRRTAVVEYVVYTVGVATLLLEAAVLGTTRYMFFTILVYLLIGFYFKRRNDWYCLHRMFVSKKFNSDKCKLLRFDDGVGVVELNGVEYPCYAYPCLKDMVGKNVVLYYSTNGVVDSLRLAYPT